MYIERGGGGNIQKVQKSAPNLKKRAPTAAWRARGASVPLLKRHKKRGSSQRYRLDPQNTSFFYSTSSQCRQEVYLAVAPHFPAHALVGNFSIYGHGKAGANAIVLADPLLETRKGRLEVCNDLADRCTLHLDLGLPSGQPLHQGGNPHRRHRNYPAASGWAAFFCCKALTIRSGRMGNSSS